MWERNNGKRKRRLRLYIKEGNRCGKKTAESACRKRSEAGKNGFVLFIAIKKPQYQRTAPSVRNSRHKECIEICYAELMLTKNFERRAATWFDRHTKFILLYAGCINKIDHKWCSPFMIFSAASDRTRQLMVLSYSCFPDLSIVIFKN